MSLSLQITQANLKKHDFAWTTYAYTVPAETPFSALLIPETWAHVAGQLRAGDCIDCIAVDGSYDALLRVASKGDLYVKMRVLRYWDAADTPEIEAPALSSEGYEVTWGGPHGKWRVIGPTKEVVPRLTGFTSKEDAEAAMNDYLVKRAA
jgi:hypothetical protein